MDVSTLRRHCLPKPGVTESRPFGPQVLVLKVGGKIFAIIADQAEPPTLSIKCEPEVVTALQETHPAVGPGYHLNKRHWVTVTLDGSIPAGDVLGWVDDSYDLVVDKLPRRVRSSLHALP